jgi:replication initiation and membrane attachment protein
MGANLRINDKFIVMSEDSLTDQNRKTLSLMYMPLVGSKAISLYYALESCMGQNRYESDEFSHRKIMNVIDLDSIVEFKHQRKKLEAVGLVDAYFKESMDLYVYFLKIPLSPQEFLSDPILGGYLLTQIGEVEFNKMGLEYLVKKYDLRHFKNITVKFDDIFATQLVNLQNYLAGLYKKNKVASVEVINSRFDYEYFSIILLTSNLVDSQLVKSDEFKQAVLRLSYVFQLSEDEMRDAVMQSIAKDQVFSYDELSRNVKYIYNKKSQDNVILLVEKNKPIIDDGEKSYEIKRLESSTPEEILRVKTNMVVSPSDLMIFDELLKATNLPIGVINVMIIYVLAEKEGALPSYNYFLKIANTWARANINTTKKALEYINKPKSTQGSKAFQNQTKESPVPDWYPKYVEDMKSKRKPKEKISIDLEELSKKLDETFKGGKQ